MNLVPAPSGKLVSVYDDRSRPMTFTLTLPPDKEDDLRVRAAKEGVPADLYALRLLTEALDAAPPPRPFYETATPEEWIAAFNQWVYSHDPNGPVLTDDSREGIYED